MSALEKLLAAAKAYRDIEEEVARDEDVDDIDVEHEVDNLRDAARDPALDEPAWTSERPTEPIVLWATGGVAGDERWLVEVFREDGELWFRRHNAEDCAEYNPEWIELWCRLPEPPNV